MKVLEQQQLNIILNVFVAECKVLFGDMLFDVRLFGSYARGDESVESDIDIMVILDMSSSEARKCLDSICHIASELDLKFNISIMPVLQSKSDYELRKHSYGFYKNVETEGISMYARQVYA